jgi:hypothetical protein
MIGAGDKISLEEARQVALFDPETQKVGQPIPIAGGMRGMAFDPTSNTLWVGSATDGTLTHIDADSGRVLDTFRADGLPSGGSLISTGRNELWVGPFTGGLLKIDLARQRVVARLEQAPFGTGAFAVVSAGGYLWLSPLSWRLWFASTLGHSTSKLWRAHRTCALGVEGAPRRSRTPGLRPAGRPARGRWATSFRRSSWPLKQPQP